MKKIINYLKKYLAIVAGVILAMLFYLMDAAICLSTSDHGSIVHHLSSTTPEDIFHRFVVTSMFILFGVAIHILLIRRKAAETKAADNQIRYQGLFSSMLNGFAWHKIIVDENGRPVDYEYLEVNHAFEKLTGLNRKDILFKRVTEVIPELKNDDFDWIGTYGRVALNNEKIQFEQYSKAFGKWYNITAYSPSKGEFATVLEDITERKKIESVVRENQERMDTLFNSIQAGIMVIDRETHTIAFVNQAAVKMIGATPEQLLDQPCQKYVCSATCGECPITDLGQKIDNSERVLLTADGRQVPILKTVVETELDGRQVLVESFVDITERKLAEQELRESKALVEAVVENIPNMIFLKEATDLRFVMFNRAGEELLGYDRAALLGKNNLDLFPPEQAAHFMAKDREVLDGAEGILDIPEEPIQTAKQGQRLLHTKKICIKGADGVTKYLLGISEDITERRQTEEELRESEEKFRLITENTADTITVMGLDLKITYVSPSIQKLRGYTAEEAKTQSIDQIILPAYLPMVYKTFKEQMALEADGRADPTRTVVMELEESCKDGTVIWAEVTMSFLRNKKNQAAGIVTMTKDITERRRAEEKLKESETQKRLILQSMPVAVYTSKINQETDATWISGNVDELTGFSVEEFLSEPDFWRKRLHPDDLDRVLAAFKDAAVSGRGEIEYLWRHRDGHYKWFQDRFIVNQVAGQPVFLGVMSDVTQRKLYEKEIKDQTLFFETLIDTIINPVFYKDTEGKYLGCNKAFEELMGLTKEQIVEKTVFELTSPERAGKHQKMDRELLKNGGIQTYEYQVQSAKQGLREMLFNKAVFKDTAGNPKGIVGVMMDVTDRAASMREIEKVNRQIKLILDSVGEGIYGLDSQGKTVFINPTGAQLLGYQPEETVGKAQHELTHHTRPDGSPYEREDCPIHTSFVDGQVHHVTGELFWRKDGSSFPVEYVSTPISEDGQNNGSVVVFRDVTERERSDKLQSALYHIAEAVVKSDNLGTLYGEIHKTVSELIPAKNFYIALYHEKEDMLSFPYFVDEVDPAPEPRKLANGLTEYVLKTGTPLLASPVVLNLLIEQGKVSMVGTPAIDWAGVPLKAGNKTLGALVVQSYREDVRFGAEDLSMLNFVSDNIALAIARKNDEEERKKSEKLQGALYHISEAAAKSDNLETLYGEIHKVVAELTSTKNFYLAIYHEKEQLLSFPYSVDEFDPRPQARKLGHGLTEYVLNTGIPLLADREMQQLLSEQGKTSVVGTPAVEWAGVPLKMGGRIMGVLVIQSYREDVRFGAEALSMLNFVSDHIALAISRKNGEEERKKLMAELRKLSLAVEQSPSMIVITDLEGNIEYANPAFEKITGYSLAEAQGKNPRILKSGELPDEAYKQLWETISSGGEWRGQFHNKRKDGRLYWEQASIAGIRDTEGNIVKYLAVKEDITERMMMEDGLKASEAQNRALVESAGRAGEAIMMLQNSGDIQVACLVANQEVVRITGYSQEELKNISWLDLVHPRFREESQKRAQARLHNEDIPGIYEISIVSKYGVEIPVEVTGSPAQYQGRPAMVGFFREISQRKKAEAEREKMIAELKDALANIKQLKGLIPICASCKKIRNDGGYWQQVEEYVSEHTEADFSHGLCEECAHKLYPDYFPDKKNEEIIPPPGS